MEDNFFFLLLLKDTLAFKKMSKQLKDRKVTCSATWCHKLVRLIYLTFHFWQSISDTGLGGKPLPTHSPPSAVTFK